MEDGFQTVLFSPVFSRNRRGHFSLLHERYIPGDLIFKYYLFSLDLYSEIYFKKFTKYS